MTTRTVIGLWAALIVALSVACSASREPRLYTLRAIIAPTDRPLAVSVAVGPILIPAIVDSSQIVVNINATEVRANDFDRWASPLQANIGEIIATDLASRLGTADVMLARNVVGPTPDFRASVEVQRFEIGPGTTALLDALWVVRRSNDGQIRRGRTTVQDDAVKGGFDAAATAQSRAFARLSDDVAGAVRSLATAPR